MKPPNQDTNKLSVEIKQLFSLFTQQEVRVKFKDAAKNNYIELVKYLLKSKDLSFNPEVEYSELNSNIENISLEMFQLLIIEYQKKHKDNFSNLLFQAVEKNRLDLIDYLLTSPDIIKKLDIKNTQKNYYGKTDDTLLSIACQNKNIEIVQYLLCSPNIKSYKNFIHQEQDAALCNALNKYDNEIVKFLLTSDKIKEHADINARNGKFIERLTEDVYSFRLTENINMLKFLITECNIVLNEKTREMIQDIEEVNSLYELRDLKNNMEENLNKNQIIIPKRKL